MDTSTQQPIPQQPVAPTPQTQPLPVQGGSPVSVRQPQPSAQSVMAIQPAGGGKEAPKMPSAEWVSSSTPEVVLPKEVAAVGVEVKPVMPSVPKAAQQAGVVHAKEATPVTPVKAEPLGMKTPKSVLVQLKDAHKKVTEGFSWLVRLIIKEQEKKEEGPVV